MDLGDFLRDLVDGVVVWPAAFNAGLLSMMATVALNSMAWAWKRDPPF